MALSLSSAVKQYLESTSATWRPSAVVGCPIFRDDAPGDQAYPYITVSEGLSLVPSTDLVELGTEMAQVSVWQTWKPQSAVDGSAGYDGLHKESPPLGPQVAKQLHLARFDAAPQRVLFATVTNAVRLPDRDANNVHTAITLYVRRLL